ncbi:hypothetical protein GGX14DRAFT_425871 [Mycena pura]|uniref:FHA domain-containing protein n=1 Tax=Mycena pura TaxID=153505 RepID=A0AAD6YNL1_9AGAR|nr:hypothetical protein GGX14DRAFT_425871 [Mycena pura]
MADDDSIQYLGTRPSALRFPGPSLPLFSSLVRPVTGVALHILKTDAEPGYSLTFRKAEEPMVQIGRRPGSPRDSGKSESSKAFFSCPVVSRQHAKLIFSDSGQVYIIDTNSHHGTHVRKKNEIIPKKLKPETPTLVDDGDVVTFGKAVGADKGIVRPIAARVELLYGALPPIRPLVVPGGLVRTDQSPFGPFSGRYGVHASSDASSDSADEHESQDSDIEVSGPSRPPWQDNGSDSASSPQKLECLPAYSPIGLSDFFSPEPQDELRPEFYNFGFNYDEESFEEESFEDDDDNSDNSDNSHYSRSTSPMDLASSPEPSTTSVKENIVTASEPVIIGAWPHSRFSSPSPAFLPAPIVTAVTAPVKEIAPAPEPPLQAVDPVEDESENAVIVAEISDPSKTTESTENAELKASLTTLKAEVAKLQTHRRKYKQRFNDNIKVMTDKFSDLEERTTEVHDLYNFLSDKVEENVDACQQAQAQLDVLQLDLFQSRITDAPDAPQVKSLPQTEDAKQLKDLIAGMLHCPCP